MSLLATLWSRAVRPVRGFAALAEAPPPLGPSVVRMLLLRAPFAYLGWVIVVLKLGLAYTAFRSMDGFLWRQALPRLAQLHPDLQVADLQGLLAQLPPYPALGPLLAWGLLAAPLGILSLWLHDAVWDHGCLWMLGAVRARGGFRTTLVAEAEALSVGAIGALAGLLGEVPVLGLLLGLPLAVLALYFWVLRGIALAAFHGVPTWKGILATVLHLLLAACCLGSVLALALLVLLLPAG